MGASCSCNEIWCEYMTNMRNAAKRRHISRHRCVGRRPKCLRIRRKLPECKCTPTTAPETPPNCPGAICDNNWDNVKPDCEKHVTFNCPVTRDTRTNKCACSNLTSYSSRSVQCPDNSLSNTSIRLDPICNCFVRNKSVCRFTVDAYFN